MSNFGNFLKNFLKFDQFFCRMTELAMWRYWRPYFKDPIFYLLPQGRQYRRILRDLQAFSAKVITYKKQVLGRKEQAAIEGKTLEDNALCRSFLDIVMEATDKQNIMSDSDLKSLVDTFLLAVRKTHSSNIPFTVNKFSRDMKPPQIR